MKGNDAAGAVSFAALFMLLVGGGNAIVVDGKSPSFRFLIAVAITGFGLASVATVNATAAKGFSVIVITVVAIDDLPPLLKKLGKIDSSTVVVEAPDPMPATNVTRNSGTAQSKR